nr:MAG TPA: Protein of unknown function (DUF1244) [Caudoviricetes sp.]
MVRHTSHLVCLTITHYFSKEILIKCKNCLAKIGIRTSKK